ncbi:hypothetical protein, conserved [Leishmania tarentolae]|uniref:C2HC/C3H-type domain-containing protein n=1 Tax=Leishmania tarentolae TaxID=5689 RepID=A0A640KVZ9_LEITA|nr:hypothetical protein, conserved [Leishmania tarentolae]
MNTTQRTTAPSELGGGSLAGSHKGGTLTATPRSATHLRSTNGKKADDRDLIVTRGLKQLLEEERKHRGTGESMNSPAPGRKAKAKGPRRSLGQAPNFIICYLCGRQFGTASIDIHRPQCYLKRLIAWERGDPAIRGPKPLNHEEHEKMMKMRTANAGVADGFAAGGGYSSAGRSGGGRFGKQAPLKGVELYNQLQMEAYNDTALSPCPNCGRTFLPDRLQVHLKSCKPGKTAKPVSTVSSRLAPPVATPSTATTSDSPALTKDRGVRPAGGCKAPASAGSDSLPSEAESSSKPLNHTMSTCTSAHKEVSLRERQPAKASLSESSGRVEDEPNKLVLAANAPKSAVIASKVPDSDVIEVVVEVDAEDTKPPSPRAATERRLSFVPLTGTDPDMIGSSAPNRPALMEPSLAAPSTFSAQGRIEHSNGNGGTTGSQALVSRSTPRDTAATKKPPGHSLPSTPQTADVPGLKEEQQAEGSSGANHHCDPSIENDSAVHDELHGDADGEHNSGKKIRLNNVSHFKNVSSRLNLQLRSMEADLVPCTYCGRKFLPERVQRHADCCIERNKPLAARKSNAPPAQSSTRATTPKRAKPTPAASAVESTAPGKAKFCGGCGCKVSESDQKFCTKCGHKL